MLLYHLQKRTVGTSPALVCIASETLPKILFLFLYYDCVCVTYMSAGVCMSWCAQAEARG